MPRATADKKVTSKIPHQQQRGCQNNGILGPYILQADNSPPSRRCLYGRVVWTVT